MSGQIRPPNAFSTTSPPRTVSLGPWGRLHVCLSLAETGRTFPSRLVTKMPLVSIASMQRHQEASPCTARPGVSVCSLAAIGPNSSTATARQAGDQSRERQAGVLIRLPHFFFSDSRSHTAILAAADMDNETGPRTRPRRDSPIGASSGEHHEGALA